MHPLRHSCFGRGLGFFGDPIDPLLERFGGGCLFHPALSVLVIATAHLSMDVRHTRLPIAILVKSLAR